MSKEEGSVWGSLCARKSSIGSKIPKIPKSAFFWRDLIFSRADRAKFQSGALGARFCACIGRSERKRGLCLGLKKGPKTEHANTRKGLRQASEIFFSFQPQHMVDRPLPESCRVWVLQILTPICFSRHRDICSGNRNVAKWPTPTRARRRPCERVPSHGAPEREKKKKILRWQKIK